MWIGDVVADRFVVERAIGSGGMGSIFYAADRLTDDAVAIKVLDAPTSDHVERFRREARVLSELAHPSIVRYVAHGETQAGEAYLAMEWLRGEDLADRLRRERLSDADALALCERVCEGLAAAHERGIVHRDIKPANLFLVDGDPRAVKILDFGIARVHRTMQSGTKTGSVLGTPGYMAPEQARADDDVGAPADVFSVGCVLYECLTGRPAFAGVHFMAILAKILLEPSPRIRDLRPDISSAIDDLVARMLAKHPAQRLPDALAVRAELSRLGVAASERMRIEAPPSLTNREQELLCVLLIAGNVIRRRKSATTLSSDSVDEAGRLREVAEQHGAELEILEDRTIIAIFEPEAAATDLATRAAQCALALRALVPDAPMALATGQGVVSGRVPIGPVIDRAAEILRAQDASSSASRSKESAEGARIGLDRLTAGLIDAHFEIAMVGSRPKLVRSRGLQETGRLLLGKPTACVGRERELATLEAIFGECVREPAARAVLITGPPGAGKSRLRHEFIRAVPSHFDHVRIWHGWGDPTRAGSPFGLLTQVLRASLGVIDGEPIAFAQQKMRDRISGRFPTDAGRRVMEFLGELVGVQFPDEDSIQLHAARRDPRIMGDQMARAWEEWVELECTEAPIIIVLEDLHWGDLPTVKLVDSALRSLKNRPLFVLALSRPEISEIFPGLWKDRPVEEIRLPPLPKRACEALVRAVLGEVESARVARVVQRAEGNAFYLEELIRAESEGHTDFPETMLAMVQARFGRLPPNDRQVLRAASVFGQFFWDGGVRALCGASALTRSSNELTNDLIDREWVRRTRTSRLAGETEYEFGHALLRESAYSSLTDEDRTTGHRLAGLWLESAGEHDAAALAEHFQKGGDLARAMECYLRAAEQALEGDDLLTVIAHAERGVACGAEGVMLGRLRLLQAEAHNWRGEFAKSAECAAEAMARLGEGGNSAVGYWADAINHLNWAVAAIGRYDEVDRLAKALLDITNKDANERVVYALANVGSWQVALSRPGATETSEWLRQHTEVISDPLVAAAVKSAQALFEANRRNIAAAAFMYEAAAAAFAQIGHRRLQCMQGTNAAINWNRLGQYERAENALRVAISVTGRGWEYPDAMGVLGRALAGLGELENGQRLSQDCVAALHETGDAMNQTFALIELSRLLCVSGDDSSAEQHAITAVELATGVPMLEAYSRAALASSLLAQNRAAEALEPASKAFGIAESLGTMEDGDAFIYLTYAETLDAVGNHAAARDALRAAHERLMAVATRIDNDDFRRSFLERVPENARTLELVRRWFPTDHG